MDIKKPQLVKVGAFAYFFEGVLQHPPHYIYTGRCENEVAKGDERVALSPDMLWADNAGGVTVTKGASNTLTLYPGEAVCTYTVTVRNAENLK